MIKKTKTHKLGASVIALALVAVMVFTMIPTAAFAKTADLDTTTKYTESLGDNASTEYAGRVWTDKTVYEGDAAFDLYGGGKATVENDSDFLVAYSALATSQAVTGDRATPLDVVFVLDMSGSMRDNQMDAGGNRLQNAAAALNDSMEKLLALNEYVRVGVVAFNTTSYTILPLDHYEKIGNNDFVAASSRDTIRVYANGTESQVNGRTWTVKSGTNMQKGFYEGMYMLANEESTTVEIEGKLLERTPNIVILSDGEPSKDSDYETWWNIHADATTTAQTNPQSLYGMKALMTASYMKKAIDRNYGTPEVSVYSIGVGIADISNASYKALAYASINPAEYLATNNNSMVSDIRNTWNKYAKNERAELQGFTFNHPPAYDIVETGNYSDLYYVDHYYDVRNKAMMDSVFSAIVENIILDKAEAPTEITTDNPLTDGYITYTDPLGDYMEVKNLKSVLYAGQEFELPAGYTPVTDSDGNLIYKFTGEVHSAVYGDQNLENIIIKVSPEKDKITIMIPATLIPIRVNSVNLDADGHVITHTNNGAYPIRVLYTVGLKEGVLSADGSVTGAVAQEYIDANSNDDGTVNFYSNKYSGRTYTLPDGREVTVGDATVEFSPAKTNPFYYVQEDMIIYTDEACTIPAKGELEDSTTYYYKDEFYHETHSDFKPIQRTGKQLKAEEVGVNSNGELVRKAGTPRVNRMLEFEGEKQQNATNTASEFYVPTFNTAENDILVYLGNNGVMSAKAGGTLEFSKEVTAAEGFTAPKDKEFTFTVDLKDADGTYNYVVKDSAGNIVGDSDSDGYTGTIADGGNVVLKDGQTAEILNLPPGADWRVTEDTVNGFTTTVNGTAGNEASGEIVAGETSSADFVNSYSADSVKVDVNTAFDGEKIFTGRDWTAGDEFTFKLESRRPDTPMPEGSVTAGDPVSHKVKEVTVSAAPGTAGGTPVGFGFGTDGEEITYTVPGIYEYVISEKMPAVDLPGVSYSGAMYIVTVTVTDNGDGTLKAEAVMSHVLNDMGEDFAAADNVVEKATFTNTFDTDEVTWVPVGSKYYIDNSGANPVRTGMFEFEMKGLDGAPMPARAEGKDTFVVSNVDTEVAYDAVVFTQDEAGATKEAAKVYTYEFREVIPSPAAPGMTYDTNIYTVTVKVYLEDGKIVVAPEYPEGTRLLFTNIYTPEKAAAVIEGTKSINGRDWLDSDVFTFELTAVTADAPMPSESAVTVDKDDAADESGVKAFDFGNIEYTKAGVYEYTITETGADKEGIVIDKHVSNVTVTVTDAGGKLNAAVTYSDGDAAEFVNTYTTVFDPSTTVNVKGSKVLTGKALLAGEFYFRVEPQNGAPMGSSLATNPVQEDGTFDILKNVTYDKAGTYYYVVSEAVPVDAEDDVHQGITYDTDRFTVKVTVTDDNKGNLTASYSILKDGNAVDAVEFENTYNASDAEVDLPVGTKVVSGRTFDPAAEKYEFKLSVASADPADGIELPADVTVKTDDSGKIDFAPIKFTEPGTYVVEVAEIIPAEANAENNYTVDGMTYDTDKMIITVRVVDNGAGELIATYSNVSGVSVFENIYKAASVDATFRGEKILNGRSMTDEDEFNFVITAKTEGAPMPAVTTVTNDGSHVSFGPVTFDATGVYEYEITETDTDADGITYDKGKVTATVTVTDNGYDGQLDAEVTYTKDGEGKGFQFINEYNVKPVDVGFDGTKTIDGVKLLEGKFSFVLRPVDANPAEDPVKEVKHAVNKADGTFDFGDFTYTEPGVYVYSIAEEAGEYHGMEYDATLYTVTVTVTDNGKGQLVAVTDVLKTNPDESKESVTADDILFHNIYNEDEATVIIHGHKYLEGAEMTDKQFEFEIKAKTAGAPVPELTRVASTAAGAFSFPEIKFYATDFGTEAKVFEYEVTEVKGTAPGYTYDSSVQTVKVTVQKDEKGILYATAEYKNGHAVEFTNTYKAKSAATVIEAEKTLKGRELKDGEFIFELKGEEGAPMPADAYAENDAEGNVIFGEIEFTETGIYKYTVTETANGIGGVSYDSRVYGVVVEVTDEGYDGQLDTKVTYVLDGESVDVPEFSNSYTAKDTEYDLPVYEKVVSGRDFDPAEEKYSFELSVVSASPEDGIQLPATVAVQNDNSGNIDFEPIEFTKAGTYVVEVAEVIPAAATAENGYTVNGFTYDTQKITVTIRVTDDKNGNLVAAAEAVTAKTEFENKYNAKSAEVTLQGEKILNGRPLKDGEFAFELTAEAGTPMPAVTTAVNNGSGVSFGPIKYDRTGTYEYEITETDTGISGITYDTSKVTATVTVTDDGYDGQLDAEVEYVKTGNGEGFRFINEYKAASVDVGFDGTKNVEGAALLDDKFSFVLRPAETNPAADPVAGEKVVKNTAAGTFDFGMFTYAEPGVYVYGIGEEAGDYHGMQYDATLYTVTVTVTDDGTGQLKATKELVKREPGGEAEAAGSIAFVNKYSTSEATAIIHGHKHLEGAELAGGQFEFKIEAVTEGAPLPEKTTVANTAAGMFHFSEIKFTAPAIGETAVYEYVITEVNSGKAGYTYDSSKQIVTVTVQKDSKGIPYAEVTYPEGHALEFTNSYTPEPAKAVVKVNKMLAGRDMDAGEFVFELEGETGAPMPADTIAVNDTDGNVLFDEITFTEEGTYKYEVFEMNSGAGGVTYDSSVYGVVIEVTDAGYDGQLDAAVTYTLDGKSGVEPVFNNEYKAKETAVVIKTEKKLSGRAMNGGEFAFELKGENGAPMPAETVAENTEAGTVTFDKIVFTEAGEYNYTIAEIDTGVSGVEYDDKKVSVTVKVTDDFKGSLNAVCEYVSEKTSFENSYKPEPASIKLSATKELTGRDWFGTDVFEFTLTPAEDTVQAVEDGIVKLGTSEITITKDSDNKTASFGEIVFEEPGVYNFVIGETEGDVAGVTYDTHKAAVQVTVTDNLDGTMTAVAVPTVVGSLVFVNNYTPANVTVDITGRKELTGRALAADEFEFELTAVTEGAPVPSAGTAVKNAADGSVDFGTIVYSEAGTYEYRIAEKSGDLPGITYDSSVIGVTVKVTYDKATGLFSADVSYEGAADADGFVFTNEYNTKAASVTLNADKKVIASEGNAYDMKAGDFEFVVTPSDSNPGAIAGAYEVFNNADGSVELGTFTFTEAGEYTYTVKEVSGSIPGMSYDDAVYTITAKVTDDESEAQLKTAVSITENGKAADAVVFENKYDPAETSVVIDGMKTLDSKHKALAEGDFSFELKDAEGNVIDTVENTASGTFQFGALTYDKVGTYEYTVSEVNDGKAGYTYDDAVYTVTVKVTDENGALKAAVTGGTAESIVFTNGYEPAAAELVIKGHKVLEGRDMNDGEFGFAVMDGDKEIASAVNGEGGNFTFDALNFIEAGTYNYTIVEKNTNVAGITYDRIVYGVTIKVVDENGALKVDSVEYLQNGSTVEAIEFSNTYRPAPTGIQLGAAKVLEGRDLTEGEFTFVLEDADGNELTAVNTADGKVIFDEIVYDAAGTYTYKMYEVAGDDEEITYDETVFDITVTVEDDLMGNLKAEIEGLADGAVFKNVYVPEEEPTDPTEPEDPTQPPTEPEQPTEPEDPTQPPTEPEQPTEPEDPTEPTEPEQPIEPEDPTQPPTEPEQPTEPEEPTQPPTEPEQPTEPEDPTQPPTEPEQPTEPEDPTQPPTEPEQPTEPEDPTQPPTEPTKPMDETSDGGVQTGDDFNGGLYGIMALAALAVAGAAFRRRKAE